ncbi:MAG: hypothetical protein ABMA02_10785 [Saprospiraceae bacterium]
MIDIAERKLELIQEVSQMQDEQDLNQLETTLRTIRGRQERLSKYRKPILKKFDPEAVKRRHQFKGQDKEAFMQLVRKINVQEPLEELLAMLSR